MSASGSITAPSLSPDVAKAPSRDLAGHGFDWETLSPSLRLYQPPCREARVVLATTAIRALQRPLHFWALAAVVNGPISRGDWPGTVFGALGFLLLALSTAVVLHFRSRHQNELGELLVHDLRNDLFAGLQRQPMVIITKTKARPHSPAG